MSYITVQISVYPLGTDDVSKKIDRFIQSLVKKGLVVQVGPMSSHVAGESALIFSALRHAFEEITASGEVVLTATLSNACPAWFVPEERGKKE